MKKFFTVGEVASLLHVSESTVRVWEEKGAIKSDFRTLGGHRRYTLTTIQDFLNKYKVKE